MACAASALVLAGACAHPARQSAVAPGTALVSPERYAYSVAALGYPGARRAFQVGAGSVVGNGETALEWRLPRAPGARVSPVYFETDGVPVAHWWMVSDAESVHFEAAAMPSVLLGDTSLVLSVRATAVRTAADSGTTELELRVRARADGPGFPPWDAPQVTAYDEAWIGVGAIRNGRLVAGIDPAGVYAADAPAIDRPAHTEGPGPGALHAVFRAALAAGGARSWDFWMPVYPVMPSQGRLLAKDAKHDRVAALGRVAWRDWLQHAAWLKTTDAAVNVAYAAALVTLIQCHEKNGEDWLPIGNPFQYRDVWLRDGARAVRALAVAGLGDLAVADAWTLRRFQLPPGAFLSQRGQLDGTGQALWAFEQASAYPPSREVARRLLPYAERGLRWIERQRATTATLNVPWPGLLPYGNPRDNELVRAQLVGNDAWSIAGCRAVASLAARAGDDSLARAATALAEDYRATFVAALARTGQADIPPSWQGIGRDWGNLSVGYPTGVLAPGDRRLATMAERVWRRAGGPGLVSWGPSDSLHTYLGSDLAQWALLADRPRQAREALAGLLAHSSSTFGQAELFSRTDGGFGTNLPPHATASADLVDLVRNMLLSERNDTLAIAAGAPAAWWDGTRFMHAPTRFGMVTLTLERPAKDRLRAAWDSLGVTVSVRVPDGMRLVEPPGSGARARGDRWVDCPPGARQVELHVREEGSAQ